MKTIRKEIIEDFNMGDYLGFEKLKAIATKEDQEILSHLINESWKVVYGIHNNEEAYHENKRNIFLKYEFDFDNNDQLIDIKNKED